MRSTLWAIWLLVPDPFSKLRLTFAIDNPTALQVVWRNFDHNTIARHNPDKVFTHFSCNVCHDLMAVFKLHAKLSVRECFDNVAFDLN